jgi:glucosamine-6-phosphate deaminase
MSLHLDILPAATWAEEVAAELAAVLRDRPGLRLVLPAGDTPTPVYAALATLVASGAASLTATEVLLLDEYLGLPPGHPARCDERLRRELLGRLPAPPAAFHAVQVDALPPGEAAAAHDAVAARGIDLALLGLGANGHVGLNEPGSRPDAPTRVVDLAPSSRRAAAERYGADPAPTAGITIGLDRLQAAGEIWLLVTGEPKAWILARVLEEPVGPDCPASLLRRHPALRVIADEAAAGELRRQT